MKKFFKWVGYIILAILIILNLIIICTGRFYIYKAVANTYLKGRSGPSIDEYGIFPNRVVKTGTPMPWPISKDYNKKSISKEFIHEIENYQTEAFLIIQNDSICFEQYWDGYSDTSHTNSFS